MEYRDRNESEPSEVSEKAKKKMSSGEDFYLFCVTNNKQRWVWKGQNEGQRLLAQSGWKARKEDLRAKRLVAFWIRNEGCAGGRGNGVEKFEVGTKGERKK